MSKHCIWCGQSGRPSLPVPGTEFVACRGGCYDAVVKQKRIGRRYDLIAHAQYVFRGPRHAR